MPMKRKEQVELSIWKEIAGLNMSVSHDRWHIDRVLAFALELQQVYGGDMEVLTAAALMHDLGRADERRAHGASSREASVEQAEIILAEIEFPESKREAVLTAIAEHDQHEITPSTLEGRILKDADFLAGFGAWGILRIAMWSGESRRRVGKLLERLTEKMPKRLDNLEFPESKHFGWREMLFADVFLQELNREPTLPTRTKSGSYIVLEGISGSGKSTQARLLKGKFEELSYAAETVHEPADNYRMFRDAWQEKHGDLSDPNVMKFLLMADRYQFMQNVVYPALREGKIVISGRSFVSTLVYQCNDDHSVALTALHHGFVPLPDKVILLDAEPQTVWKRIENRDKPPGLHEKPELLELHRARYLSICNRLFGKVLHIVDASRPIVEVSDEIWAIIRSSNLIS